MEIYNSKEAIALLLPYLQQLLSFVLSLLSGDYGAEVHKPVLEILVSTAEMAPKLMQDSFPVEMRQFVQALLVAMSHIPGEATDRVFWDADVDDHSAEEEQLHIIAEDTLDRLLHVLGGALILPVAFDAIPSMLCAEDWRQRYAALSAIGTLAEGSTSEFQKDIQPIAR